MKESKPQDQTEADPFAGLKVSLESWLRAVVSEEVEKALTDLRYNARPSPTLLTVEELAEALHVPKSWVYDRTRRNAIPHVKVGRYPRFDLDEVIVWLKTKKVMKSSPFSMLKSRG